MKAIATTILAGLIVVTATPAVAQAPRFSASFEIPSELALAGDVHGGGTGTVLDLPTTVGARSYGDIYGSKLNWAAGFGARVAANTEFRARVFRTTGDANRVQVGDVASLPLFAEFDRYTATGADFGLRQYFGDESQVQPYAGVSAGFVRANAINSTFSVPAASVVLADVPMLKDSTAPTVAFSGGVLIPVNQYVGIQAGVDLRWVGNLEPIDGLAGTGLEAINDQTSRWSMPITVGAMFRF